MIWKALVKSFDSFFNLLSRVSDLYRLFQIGTSRCQVATHLHFSVVCTAENHFANEGHVIFLKFIYSERATKFCEIFILLLTGTT